MAPSTLNWVWTAAGIPRDERLGLGNIEIAQVMTNFYAFVIREGHQAALRRVASHTSKNLAPLLELQPLQAGTTLSRACAPPCEIGTTCSSVVAGSRQYTQSPAYSSKSSTMSCMVSEHSTPRNARAAACSRLGNTRDAPSRIALHLP